LRKSKDLTQRSRREGGEKSEEDSSVHRSDAEDGEKTRAGAGVETQEN
jgi:hypothetical protein